jgi:hypothetical protein
MTFFGNDGGVDGAQNVQPQIDLERAKERVCVCAREWRTQRIASQDRPYDLRYQDAMKGLNAAVEDLLSVIEEQHRVHYPRVTN